MESKTQEFQSPLGKKKQKPIFRDKGVTMATTQLSGRSRDERSGYKGGIVEKRLAINRSSLGKIYVLAKWWWQ